MLQNKVFELRRYLRNHKYNSNHQNRTTNSSFSFCSSPVRNSRRRNKLFSDHEITVETRSDCHPADPKNEPSAPLDVVVAWVRCIVSEGGTTTPVQRSGPQQPGLLALPTNGYATSNHEGHIAAATLVFRARKKQLDHPYRDGSQILCSLCR